jgi:hypothetical protein
MKALRIFLRCSWLAVACATAACGDDDGGGPIATGGTSGASGGGAGAGGAAASSGSSGDAGSSGTAGMAGGGGSSGGQGGTAGEGGVAGGGGTGGTPGCSSDLECTTAAPYCVTATRECKSAAELIAAVRAAAGGSGLALPVRSAFVTYTKPAIGNDPAGFFLQATQAGPAVYVAVDPVTLNPVPAVGDLVDLTAQAVAISAGRRPVTAVGGLNVISSGNAIAPLVTDVSAADDLVTALDSYESRVIKVTGQIRDAFFGAGAPQVQAYIITAALDDGNLRLRMPETVRAELELGPGCSLTLDYGPMWRFSGVAQPSTVQATDLKDVTCPAPTVVQATALSSTEVRVVFDRTIDPQSVQTDGSQFTIAPALAVTGATVAGKEVTLQTAEQTMGGDYTVTVASSVLDALGKGVGTPNSADFVGFTPEARLLINEVGPNITGGRDLVEILVASGGSIEGVSLFASDGATNTRLADLPSVIAATGDLIVVHLTPPAEIVSETSSKAECTSTDCYAGAWDVRGYCTATCGVIAFTKRVIRLQRQTTVIEGVPFSVDSGDTPAGYPTAVQALQSQGLWLPADCGGSPCTFTSTPNVREISVIWTGVGNSVTGNSVARKPGADTKQNSDWYAPAAPSWGLPNP